MKTISSIAAVPRWRKTLYRQGLSVGLVPTMGALHDGHRALIKAARRKCDVLIVSIFVNPTQFGPQEDFGRYPRRLRLDQALCRAEGVDVVLAPESRSMYPAGFQTIVSVPDIARRWEGTSRPTHFQGVATIVTKLLCLARPDMAVFGQKDYQQAALIRRLTMDLNIACQIIVHPTVRDADGLALSSRNMYLSPIERKAAPILYRSLLAGAQQLYRGIRSGEAIVRAMARLVASEPLAQVDYLAVCDPITLEPLKKVQKRCVLLGAMRVGKIRLIDNLMVGAARGRLSSERFVTRSIRGGRFG